MGWLGLWKAGIMINEGPGPPNIWILSSRFSFLFIVICVIRDKQVKIGHHQILSIELKKQITIIRIIRIELSHGTT